MDLYQQHWWHPVHSEIRVPKTKWVVLRYPTDAMAQAANMSTAAFEDFFFTVCTADYARMAKDQEPLVKRMKAADRVRIVAPGTDLRFSIRGMTCVPATGSATFPTAKCSPPRCATASKARSATTPRRATRERSSRRSNSSFSSGKIVRAASRNEPDKLNQMLDSDEGARYIGEWSIGCNNLIRQPMLDTLFDEKIGGSIHLTPGNAYDECDNGNRSRVHWDLVLIQTPDYGGGEIWFDDQLVRKDGRFLPADLQGLNAGL